MAIVLVTSGSNSAASNVAVTIDSTGCNLLVVSVSHWIGVGITSLSDGVNTFIPLTARGAVNPSIQQFYCLNPTTNASHTITATVQYGAISVHAFSGVGAYHAEAGSTTNGTSLATGSITPPSDGAVLIAALSIAAASTETGAGTYTGFTQRAYLAANYQGIAFSYYIQPTAAAVQETFSGSSIERAAAQCCFTAAVATGQPASRRMGGVKFAGNQSLGINRW